MTPLPAALHAALVGVARSQAAPHLLLRGSIPLSKWSRQARVPQDVDFLSLQSITTLDLQELIHHVQKALQDARFGVVSVTQDVLWPNTEFYGVRIGFHGSGTVVQIDIGEGDPVLGPLQVLQLTDEAQLSMVGPLLSFSWKLHGLFEFGRGRWETKTLQDLWILTTEVLPTLPPARGRPSELQAAIATAFWSHHHDLDLMMPFLDEPEWGQGRKNRRQWRSRQRSYVHLPSLDVALGEVRAIVEQPVRDLVENVRSIALPRSLFSDPALVSPLIRAHSADELRSKLAHTDIANEGVWIAWPKVTSSLPRGLEQTSVRTVAAEFALTDVQARSVDHDWTALNFEPVRPRA